MRERRSYIVVLSDGETWTMLEGCQLVSVPASWLEEEQIGCYDADDFENEATEAGLDPSRIIRLDLEKVLQRGVKISKWEQELEDVPSGQAAQARGNQEAEETK